MFIISVLSEVTPVPILLNVSKSNALWPRVGIWVGANAKL